jgi:DivIVA domain-containing protein
MSDDESAVSRRFVAKPWMVGIGPKWSPTRAYLQMYGFLAVLIAGIGVVALVLSVSPWSETRAAIGLGAGFGFLIVVGVGLRAYYWWHNQQKILIGVTSDGLTVNKRPGDVFQFSDVTLGPWGWGAGTMGTALHLRCGRHRFVLGGRDHRTGSGTRLDEAPVPGVDAWLWAAEFDQILTMVGRRTELDVRPPTPGEPTRYVLFPNPLRIQAASASKTSKQLKLFRSASNLAVDVGADAIRVVDPNTNALIASASPTQVTATPATYQYPYTHWYPSLNNVVTDFEMQYLSKAPELILCVPGAQPLTIACLDVDTGGALPGIARRFSWRDDVPVEDEPAEYAVSGADWPTLVEKFGLAPYLERRGELGEQRWMAQPEHRQAGAVQRPGLTVEDVRNVVFSEAAFGERSYSHDEVDAFLDRVAAVLQEQTGHTLTPEQVRSIVFSKPPFGSRGYAVADVDEFVDRVEIELTRRAGQQPVAYPGAGGSQHQGDTGAVPHSAVSGELGFENRTESGRRRGLGITGRRRGGWGTIVALSFASVAIIAFGTFFMWVQHFGVPARVTVQQCQAHSGTRITDHLFNYAFGDSCTASSISATREGYVEFWGVYQKDVGRDIDVHIFRGSGVFDEAVPDAWIVPPIAIGVGGVLGVAAVIGIVRRLRRAPT